jgi:hypothetical protein
LIHLKVIDGRCRNITTLAAAPERDLARNYPARHRTNEEELAMRTATVSLVWPAILSAVMLLPCATSSIAEEFVNTGGAPLTQYGAVPQSNGAIGYQGPTAPYFAGQYSDPYSAYAAGGYYSDFACQVSPGDPWRRGFCEPVAIVEPR